MLTVDHVTVAGADLRRMQAELSRAGIRTVSGGAHHRGGTEMAQAAFPDGSYLELLALNPNAHPSVAERHMWSRFLKSDAGACAWATAMSDLEGEMRRLRMAGIAVAGPAPNGRLRPDGVRLNWEIATPGAGPAGSFFPFLIRDLTARELRAAPPGSLASEEFSGVARVVLGVRNLDGALVRYRQAFGLSGAHKFTDPEFGAQLAVLSDAPIVLAQPLEAGSWLASRIELYGDVPCAILLAAADPEPKCEIHSRWFDLQIHWFDHGALQWRLGSVYQAPHL